MNVQSSEGQLAKNILCEFMEQFQKKKSELIRFFQVNLHIGREQDASISIH